MFYYVKLRSLFSNPRFNYKKGFAKPRAKSCIIYSINNSSRMYCTFFNKVKFLSHTNKNDIKKYTALFLTLSNFANANKGYLR